MKIAHQYADKLSQLGSATRVTPVQNPILRHVNTSLLEELALDPELFNQPQLFQALFSDKGLFNQQAFAQKYAGHQFGQWNPQLGDGRGLLLAEVIDKHGQSWDLHLKGAGKTPYSRFGDGRAVLRSTIREYLASEALHHLGIPTSRALCLISSDTPVIRERQETAAMMIRTCQSHIRFGHFEYYYHTQQSEQLQQLFDFCLQQHFPDCLSQDNPHLAMLEQIVTDTAKLIAKWQAFGFAHGVMNTDNMSIHGITFDFGPYAFMDEFNPGLICNHSDHSGRYAFDQQPGVALWNLNALAHAFSPYLDMQQIKQALSQYEPTLLAQYSQLMRHKLGLQQQHEQDQELLNQLLQQMHRESRDYTQIFRALCHIDIEQSNQSFIDLFIDRQQIQAWLQNYNTRLRQESQSEQQRQTNMRLVNPKYILRNYLAQQAIQDAEQGDFDELHQLLRVLAKPFDEQIESQHYASPPPDWGRNMEISCSS